VKFWYRRLEKIPPLLLRVLARKRRGRPFTDQELVERSGLSVGQIRLLGEKLDWSSVTIDEMKKFFECCGIDLFSRTDWHRVTAYLRTKPKWTYLKKSQDWPTHRKRLLRLAKTLR